MRRRTMWFITWMTTSVLCSVTSSYQREGYMFYTSRIINLESNLSKYEVGCTLDSISYETYVNSTHLKMTTYEGLKYETKILNETAIIYEVNLENSTESSICGEKAYECHLNGPGSSNTFLQITTILVGKPPPSIDESDFNCITQERHKLTCEIQRKSFCKFYTNYDLVMLTPSNGQIKCVLEYFESHILGTCRYSTQYEYFVLKLEHKNDFGPVEVVVSISHYDIIKPVKPQYLTVTYLNNTNVNITWELDSFLQDANRTFEHEFRLISKYGETEGDKQIYDIRNELLTHQFAKLHAFTDYELKIRVRITPKLPRKYEDEYWSDWSELNFTSKVCRPYGTHITPPEVDSLEAHQGYNTIIKSFWQLLPQCPYNKGRNFNFKVFAESLTGPRFDAPMATFQHTVETVYNISHYDILKPKELILNELNSTNAVISWKINPILRNVDQLFEYELLLMSKYDKNSSHKLIISDITDEPIIYQFSKLYAFTYYELKVRVRIMPIISQKEVYENWSDWSELQFATPACSPYHAPITSPGAYRVKEHWYDVTIEVFWQEVPEYLHNGPNFEYIVFAKSDDGERINASSTTNGMATFLHMRDNFYNVQIYSHNKEGRSLDTSMIIIVKVVDATKAQPRLKKVINDSDKMNYQLHWLPPLYYVDDEPFNYTVMYCTVDVNESCLNYIFIVLPHSATNYEVHLNKSLKFAMSVNYRSFSTEMVWERCQTSPNATFSQLVFEVIDQRQYSAVLQLDLSCEEQSLILSIIVTYWPINDMYLETTKFYRFDDNFIELAGLQPDSEYKVVVEVILETGDFHKAFKKFRTASKEILIQTHWVIIIGIGLTIVIVIAYILTRRLRKMVNIEVELPSGLIGIDEMPSVTTHSDKKVAEPGKVWNRAFSETIVQESESDLPDVGNPKEATDK